MSLPTSIAIYFIIWWVVLFAVLPWGVRSQQEHGAITPGSDPGAPAIPGLKRKLVWTTIVAGIVFAFWYVVYTYRLIALDDLAALLGVATLRARGGRGRRRRGQKKSSRADNPAPNTQPHSTLRLRLEFCVTDRDGCGFTPACSSHDLDRAADNAGIGLRLDLASRTLSDLAWLVIKVKRDGAM